MDVKSAFEFELGKYQGGNFHTTRKYTSITGIETEIDTRLYCDLEANVKFLALYFPVCPNPMEVIFFVLQNPDPGFLVPMSKDFHLIMGKEGDEAHNLKDNFTSGEAVFSKRVFVYADYEPTKNELDQLEAFGNSKGIHIRFRGITYAQELDKKITPLAFISHDSRDKKLIARPLAEGLRNRGCPVWYDEYSLKVGDSLRESIERGIKECKKCILILSKHFLQNKGWTKAEFNSIFTKEMIEGKNVILPIWDKITPKEVYEYSPLLADRLGISWSKGRGEVTARIYTEIMRTE